uniref:Uncharacterized protein n=1 Tax=Anguilla anguilla TaxID=7936 RepID=A0A0E9TTR6_ANGAN
MIFSVTDSSGRSRERIAYIEEPDCYIF